MNTLKQFNYSSGLFRKADLFLYAILILAFFAIFVFIPSTQGEHVEIYSDGKLYGTYDINTNIQLKINSQEGYNIVVIDNKKVYVSEADCPGKDCVAHSAISKSNQYIVCAPNRLIVVIKGKSDIDAYTGGGN